MSSEVYKSIEKRNVKTENLFNAEVLNFPNDKKINNSENTREINSNFWKINEKSNEDQLRAVIGVCFMFVALFLMGLYSNLV